MEVNEDSKRLLFLGIPDSLHDQKWMEPISASPEFSVFFIGVNHQKPILTSAYEQWLSDHNIQLLGTLPPFSIRNARRTIYYLRWLLRQVKKHGIDQVHIFYAEPHSLWALIALFVQVKVTLTTRGSDVLRTLPLTFKSRHPFQRLVAWLYRMAFRQIVGIAVTSLDQKREVLKIDPNVCVQLIRTGINPEVIRTLGVTKTSMVPERSYVFFPRKMTPVYNHELAVEGIRQLPAEIRDQFVWVFVDCDNSEQQYARKIAEQLETVPAETRFLPAQNQADMFSLYYHAAAVVMHPQSDGTPVSALEAMAVNVPVVVGPLSYDPDIFNEQTVYKMAGWRVEDWVIAVREALENSSRANAAKIAVEKYGDRKLEMKKFEKFLLNHGS